MKRVLFVADAVAAPANSDAQRSLTFAKHLEEHGWEPIVLTAGGGRVAAALQGAVPGLQQRLTLGAAKRIFRNTAFDAVFAAGEWQALTLGRAIAEATDRPLIADFGDASSSGTDADESALVGAATAVISTTDRLRQQMANTHPAIDEERFVAIHRGFDADHLASVVPPRPDRPLRIVYTGAWTGQSNPGALYNTIDWIHRSDPRALDGIEVIAAGFASGEARRRGLSRHIREAGVLSHDESIALMRSAHLSYLCHDAPERQFAVPGNLYVCLASGTPLIAQTDPSGETARMLRRLGGGKVVSSDDPGDLYYTLLDVCRTKTVEVPPLDTDALWSFEGRALSAKLAGILDAATARAPIRISEPRAPFPAVAFPRLRTR
jgi:hypothetical protein